MNKWTADKISTQEGKTIVITGAGSGIGFEAAKVLAARGANVIMAVRTPAKGERAAQAIKSMFPDAKVSVMHLDLGDLESVRVFAGELITSLKKLDILINNAGVMIPPYRKTVQGFELQFGVNHLGHFALVGQLMPLLGSAPGTRLVTVSSIASRKGEIYFDNLDGAKGYKPMNFYRQSKLANLLFAMEFNNRLIKAGIPLKSIACHPGISTTNLLSRGSGKQTGAFMTWLMGLYAQPASMGALPTLFAATDESLKGGEYIGPDGKEGHRGYPVIAGESEKIFNPDIAAKLWEVSEKLTGVHFDL